MATITEILTSDAFQQLPLPEQGKARVMLWQKLQNDLAFQGLDEAEREQARVGVLGPSAQASPAAPSWRDRAKFIAQELGRGVAGSIVPYGVGDPSRQQLVDLALQSEEIPQGPTPTEIYQGFLESMGGPVRAPDWPTRYAGGVARQAGGMLPYAPLAAMNPAAVVMPTIGAGIGEELFQDIAGRGPVQGTAGALVGGFTPMTLQRLLGLLARHILPSGRLAATQRRAGEVLEQVVSPNARQAMAETGPIVEEINAMQPLEGGGLLRPTLGQATGDPSVIALEQTLRRGGGSLPAAERPALQQRFAEQATRGQAAIRAGVEETVPAGPGVPEARHAIQATQAAVTQQRALQLGRAEQELEQAQGSFHATTERLRQGMAEQVLTRQEAVSQAERAMDDYLATMRGTVEGRVSDAQGRVRQTMDEVAGRANPAEAQQTLHTALLTERGHLDALENAAYQAIDPFGQLQGGTQPTTKAAKAMQIEAKRSLEGPENFPLDSMERLLDPKRLAGVDSFNKLRRARGLLLEDARLEQAKPGGGNSYLVRRQKDLATTILNNMQDIAQTDSAAYSRFQEATRLTKETVNRFEAGVTGQVLQHGRQGGFRVAMSDVFDHYWNASKGVPEAAQDLIRAVGSREDAMSAVKRLALDDLRVFAEDPQQPGTLIARKLAGWRRDHASQLAAFPEIQQAVSTVAKAQESVEAVASQPKTLERVATKLRQAGITPAQQRLAATETAAAGTEKQLVPALEGEIVRPAEAQVARVTQSQRHAKRAFEQSAASRLLQGDARTALQRAIGADNQVEHVQALKRQISNEAVRQGVGPEGEVAAMNGLKRAFVDAAIDFVEAPGGVARAPRSTGVPGMANQPVWSSTRLNNIVRKFRPAMEELFAESPRQLQSLDTLQQGLNLIDLANKPISRIPESATSQNLFAAALYDALIQKAGRRSLTPILGKYGIPVDVGRRILGVVKELNHTQVQRVMVEALFDPELAMHLVDVAHQPIQRSAQQIRGVLLNVPRTLQTTSEE